MIVPNLNTMTPGVLTLVADKDSLGCRLAAFITVNWIIQSRTNKLYVVLFVNQWRYSAGLNPHEVKT